MQAGFATRTSRQTPAYFLAPANCPMRYALSGLLSVTCFVTGSLARADTVALMPLEDATISEKNLASPLGAEITLESGTTGPLEGVKRSRALLKFDLTSIPSQARVTSAVL